jgi:hypothetical protein
MGYASARWQKIGSYDRREKVTGITMSISLKANTKKKILYLSKVITPLYNFFCLLVSMM